MASKLYFWFNNLTPITKASFSAAFVMVVYIFSAALEEQVQKINSKNVEDMWTGLTWIIFLLIVALVWGFLTWHYLWFLELNRGKSEKNRRVIEEARGRVTNLTRQQLTDCDALVESENVLPDVFRSVIICESKRIDNLIAEAWAVIDSHHNRSDSPTERINFELTLITSSIQDSQLTVASWRNRDNLRPPSLNLRESNKDIYQRTEAAKMMANNITKTKIIEDTSVPSENYDSLYPDQLTRIRSSVLHPILSPKSKALGVLVLHCDEPNFFKVNESRYWHELLSIFASPIALEIERINAYNNANLALPAPWEKYQPF